jgi:hypothetical protein
LADFIPEGQNGRTAVTYEELPSLNKASAELLQKQEQKK